MDMFDDCDVELVVRDAVESGERDSTLVDDRGNKKLSENPDHPPRQFACLLRRRTFSEYFRDPICH